MSFRNVTVDELVYINEQMPTIGAIHKILNGKDRVRDMTQLAAAVARPTASAFGTDAFPTLEAKAAALLDAIARYHPFADGNKRTATLGALFLLEINGRCAVWNPAGALEQIIRVAEGRIAVAELTAWLTTEPCDPTLEPDAEQDKARIADLVTAHAWLLEQLAAR